MIRLLIYFLLIYTAFRIVKSWMGQNRQQRKGVNREATGELDNIMIKDPYCDVYFPRREGIHLKHNGNDLYFCSAECRDKYLLKNNTE